MPYRQQLLIVLLGLFVFTACKKTVSSTYPILDTVPQHTEVLISIQDFAQLKKGLAENTALQQLKNTPIYKSLRGELQVLDSVVFPEESLLAFPPLGENRYDFLISLPSDGIAGFKGDMALDSVLETDYQGEKITRFYLKDKEMFATELNRYTLVSPSAIVIENSIRNQGKNPGDTSLEKLFKLSQNRKTASIFLRSTENSGWTSAFLKKGNHRLVSGFSDWYALDLTPQARGLQFNGVALPKDSLQNLGNLFKGMPALDHGAQDIAPLNSRGLLSFTFGDFDRFLRNQQHYLSLGKPMAPHFLGTEELAISWLAEGKVALLKSFDGEALDAFLTPLQGNSENYQDYKITALKSGDFLTEYFNPLIRDFSADHMTVIGDYTLFSSETEALKAVIRNFKKGTVFSGSPVYIDGRNSLSTRSAVLFLAKGGFLQRLVNADNFKNFAWDDSALAQQSLAVQVVPESDFVHTYLHLKDIEEQSSTHAVSPLFSFPLEADLIFGPQFVTNHRSRKQEIVAQDANNTLYLISSKGELLWKKQLGGPIQGDMAQVDLYKNGKLQLAFTTDEQFMILDRNGKVVAPFEMSFPGGNLNPLAVFDYDGTKDYRFVITQGRKIHMYNNKGSIVKGFTHTEANAAIPSAPRHFRLGRKDYLVFAEGNALKIRNRVGKERVKNKASIEFTELPIFIYQDKFSAIDKKGNLVQVDEKGGLARTPLNLSTDFEVDATNKTFVSISENILSIRGKKTELDFGVYSKPKIIYRNNKIYVGLTDIQHEKVYLFDSQSRPIKGFPLFGVSAMDIGQMDADQNLELVFAETKNLISVYKM
jgi:hypothetical protein